MTLQDKIAKAKQQFQDVEPITVNVEVGGELTVLDFRPVWGDVWADLIAMNPPRHGADSDRVVGYNSDSIAKDYPVEAVTVDGEPVTQEDWSDMLSVLTAPSRMNIASTLYTLNHLEPSRKLVAAGKASRG